MATREASELVDKGDEPPSKRPRTTQDLVPSIECLNGDCLLLVLSYLPAEDLNSMAICSRRYRHARAHETLDQRRSGTIILRERCTFQSVMSKIINKDWNRVFQGNQTHLKMEGLERLPPFKLRRALRRVIPKVRLVGVTSLYLTFINPNTDKRPINISIPQLFPNLEEIDLSSVTMQNPYKFCHALFRSCPNLKKLKWTGCVDVLNFNGDCFRFGPHHFQLYLDNCCFISHYMDLESNDAYALHRCRNLQRLSIMNATWKYSPVSTEHPVSQEVLMKLVRRHSTLKWIRSDLSAENVAMLQRERPGVTFVSE